jgi:2-polyprenyl-6-methoxyphenol hydroxylase-like FAD-dependent oxidoreductase
VAIVGAGIAGITAAISLSKDGHDVSLFERNIEHGSVGAGILLAPNAVTALESLGVDLVSWGLPLQRLDVEDAAGVTLQSMDLRRLLQGSRPLLSLRRVELHQALLAALPSQVKVTMGATLDDVPRTEVDILIGADGIRSEVRDRLVLKVTLRSGGSTCWRAITVNPGIENAFERWGGVARIGVVPLTKGRIYTYLVLTAQPGSPRRYSIGEIRRHFAHFAPPVPKVLDALQAVQLLHHDLEEMDTVLWGRDNTLLIGDAAHAMTPNLGQGAAMAIEDAVVLPAVLASDSPVAELRSLRQDRVAPIQRDSRRLGQVAHWCSPGAIWFRNLLLRMTPQSVSDQQYLKLICPAGK